MMKLFFSLLIFCSFSIGFAQNNTGDEINQSSEEKSENDIAYETPRELEKAMQSLMVHFSKRWKRCYHGKEEVNSIIDVYLQLYAEDVAIDSRKIVKVDSCRDGKEAIISVNDDGSKLQCLLKFGVRKKIRRVINSPYLSDYLKKKHEYHPQHVKDFIDFFDRITK